MNLVLVKEQILFVWQTFWSKRMSYLFGGNTGNTPESLARKRQMAEQLMATATGSAPKNIGEGINALGAAFGARRLNAQLAETESAERAKAAEQFGRFAQQNGIDPSMADAMNNPYMGEGQSSIMQAVMAKKLQGQLAPEPVKGVTMGDRLVNPITGQVMADFSQQQQPDLPASAQEYEYARNQGFEGSFLDYQGMKRGNGVTMTSPDGTVMQVGGSSTAQGAFDKEAGKNEAATYKAAQDAAKAGAEIKQQVSVLRQANQNTGYSGFGSGIVGGALDMAENAGIDAPGNPRARAVLRSGGLDAALSRVQQTSGAISNAEMQLFIAAAPGLANTPEGNTALFDMMEQIADRSVKRVEAMEAYRQSEGTLQGFESAWNDWLEQNPLIVPTGDGSFAPAGTQEAQAPQDQSGEPSLDDLLNKY